MKPGYEAVIGLEVHVQLRTRSKMFCACPNASGEAPNSRTCPVCLGLPGALPVLNAEAVRMAITLGLAVEARIRPESAFYRKQYFYPDLPKGYQITQGPVALVEEGHLDIPGDERVRGGRGPVRVRLERAHLEEDAGKSHHDLDGKASHVDLNRAGLPLLEIVGAPDLRSAQEASDYLKSLHRLVVALGICDGNMEEGSFRCDANVSVRRQGDADFGTRVEVKNLNSFRFVRQALDYEVDRHVTLLEAGGSVAMETRGWDAAAGETRAQRTKEAAMDYRYFPEPDLPLLVVDSSEIEAAKAALPELPDQRIKRWCETHELGLEEAQTLAQSPAFAAYFEALAEASGTGRGAAAWMLGEVSRTLNERGIGIEAFPLAPETLAGLVRLVEARTLAFGTAKDQVFPALLAGAPSAEAIVAERGLAQVGDRVAILALVEETLASNPGPVAQIRAGKESLRGFLVGQVLKSGGGRLDARIVQEVLTEALAKP
ncbi:aspartyl/glutamyl-tRNA(Asn/Gln) amidotransferase subunit B [Geothrix limicola]|uniref:Aspartyl/glutamyl-tRNA(Asn/Gln) amidotransferase subunit B n=1 Tax=Geothrix limicola TaxID=2927978 RepID=A0ABQ5QFB9_9BACT|nr:Asp-tRNA(Asn)/Glu-tRNA(Gln) amidotransferase subunit GatB [Geothrix limicola]GLH73263.1 aspartyl/glutamyl-tRNA(Asn/Gln) amidotransferase subunit B [Geothrix limicola]